MSGPVTLAYIPAGTDITSAWWLLDEAASEYVTVQVLPKAGGSSPAVRGPFSILSLPDPIPDFGYAEG